ncbi:MAG: YncE family protein [Mycolicibacterium sp.]|uniref:YncE family protein n=1 Tax=Mycolicibacterium sp. TaxID=2320850 RepID=UPI003D1402FA
MTNLLAPLRHEKHSDTIDLRVGQDVDIADSVGIVDGDVALERRVVLGRGPIGDISVADSGTDTVVAANVADQNLSIIGCGARPTGDDFDVVGEIGLSGEPVAVVAGADRAYVVTGSIGQDTLSVIDLGTRSIAATFPLAFAATAMTVSRDGKRVFLGRTARDRVGITVIDTAAESMSEVEIGYGPAASVDALCVDPNGTRLYAAVTDVGGSRLVIIDPENPGVQRVVVVGSPIRDIAHAGDTIYVLTSDRAVGGAVHVVDLSTRRVTDTVITGGAPTQLVMSPDHARAYIVDYDRVAVLCTLNLEVVDALSFQARPSCVALGPDGTHLYVADYSGVMHQFSVESTIEMQYSHFLATDPVALSVPRARELQPARI